MTAPSSLFVSKKHEDHKEGLARLRSARFVLSSEIDPSAHFAEATLKDLTGNMTLVARHMHRSTFEFPRTFKVFMLGNHKPKSRNADPAFRSRLKLIPFKADFSNSIDPDLPKKLRREAAGILGWLIEGHRMWLENGKRVGSCKAMDDEAEAWEETQLSPQQWIEEELHLVPDDGRSNSGWPKSSELYNSYTVWARFRGAKPVALDRWSEQMQRAGFERVKSDGVRYKYASLHPPPPRLVSDSS